MEDNTETTEEMSSGSLDRIPERKLLSFIFWTEQIVVPYLRRKNIFLLNKQRQEGTNYSPKNKFIVGILFQTLISARSNRV